MNTRSCRECKQLVAEAARYCTCCGSSQLLNGPHLNFSDHATASCPNPACGAENGVHARYCRRCGSEVAFDRTNEHEMQVGQLSRVAHPSQVATSSAVGWPAAAMTPSRPMTTCYQSDAGGILSAAFSMAGSDTVVAGDQTGRVVEIKLSAQSVVRQFAFDKSFLTPFDMTIGGGKLYLETPLCIAFDPLAQFAVFGSRDGHVRLWDILGGRLLVDRRLDGGAIEFVAYSPDHRFIAAVSDNGAVRVLDRKTGAVQWTLRRPFAHAKCLAFDSLQSLLAVGYSNGVVDCWSTSNGTVFREYSTDSEGVSAVTLFPNGRYFAVGLCSGEVQIWDTETARVLWNVAAHDQAVCTVALSNDGRFVASAGVDGKIIVNSYVRRAQVAELTAHVGPVNSVAFFPSNSSIVLSAGSDGAVMLIDLRANQPTIVPAV